jgi:hypothetical protein
MGELIAEAFEASKTPPVLSGTDSLKKSMGKAGRELLAGTIAAAVLAVLGFLADPVAMATIVKDPPPQVLLLIPVINFAAKLATDQFRHRLLPALFRFLADEQE